ncbi:hypothetical protein DFQ28_003407 [Apophysomyces sp. BC1034]|nr:hypothetical protein DFQ30_003303 [Apophysomyces sp. BC1015]KAG0178950.1 hypothetical protein DFQ29_002778 [Apophysomyces sp. BC1021]KAG0189424.1 hypothetical protein DFQ28_003407 [Apophysomyces sp. BC1034]
MATTQKTSPTSLEAKATINPLATSPLDSKLPTTTKQAECSPANLSKLSAAQDQLPKNMENVLVQPKVSQSLDLPEKSSLDITKSADNAHATASSQTLDEDISAAFKRCRTFPSISEVKEPLPDLPRSPLHTRMHGRSRTISLGILPSSGRKKTPALLTKLDPSLFPPSVGDLSQFQKSQVRQTRRPRRSHSFGPKGAQDKTDVRSDLSKHSRVYPDITRANRRPPVILGKERRCSSHHRHAIRAVAAHGQCVATGSHTIKVWDAATCQIKLTIEHSIANEITEKVRSLAFAPSPDPKEAYLWAGLHNGSLMIVDAMTGEIIAKRIISHRSEVSFILQHRNTEMWTIEENGVLNMWPIARDNPLDVVPRKFQVAPAAVTAIVAGSDLWMSSGRTLDVFQRSGNGLRMSPHELLPSDLGNITQLATLPYHKQRVFASHDDGKISVWNTEHIERLQFFKVSKNSISAMVGVGEYHLWTAYDTGKIYVYDTRPDTWVVVKIWTAHDAGITSLLVDASDPSTLQVVSTDANGSIAIWDGLLTDDWIEHAVQQRSSEYCNYRKARVAICSWNINANKPEKLTERDKTQVVEWLCSMTDPPDVIAVGFQEIVDLASKRQTARSILVSHRKIETLEEADELLTHRYKLWCSYLEEIVGKTYGTKAYTVFKTEQMVGLFSCVLVKSTELSHVSQCESITVKTGLRVMKRSLHGNKGGIAIRFLWDDSSMCFVNCHLAAGQMHVPQRNADGDGILQSARFSKDGRDDVFVQGGDGTMILDHEQCFLSGDLNYRINMRRENVIELLRGPDKPAAWGALQKEDQLHKQRVVNPLMRLLLFQEAPILFDPTYKYDPGTDYYDQSEKKRVPAWCDRVLYRTPATTKSLFYRRHEIQVSDHRPISAGFEMEIKSIDKVKRAEVFKQAQLEWKKELLEMVQRNKVRYVVDYMLCNQEEAEQRLKATAWDTQKTLLGLFCQQSS